MANESRPTYAEVYDIIARFASAALVAFADKWSRFPVADNAIFILDKLKARKEWYEGQFPDDEWATVQVKNLTAAIDEITLRAEGTI